MVSYVWSVVAGGAGAGDCLRAGGQAGDIADGYWLGVEDRFTAGMDAC